MVLFLIILTVKDKVSNISPVNAVSDTEDRKGEQLNP